FEGGLTMLAPAVSHIPANVGPAARNLRPFRSFGRTTQPSFAATPPANHASDKTMTPRFSISARTSFMNWELLIRLARSWLRIRPGINVALNTGALPLA